MSIITVSTGTTNVTTSTANSYVVEDGGVLNVATGVTVSGVIEVNSDSSPFSPQEVTVSSGGTALQSVVTYSGAEFIEGLSENASVESGGEQWAIDGGVASNTVVDSSGSQEVFGGDAFFTTVVGGGVQDVYVGTGTEFNAQFAEVVDGGLQVVHDGSAFRTVLFGGEQIVSSGVDGGGFAQDTFIEGGGTEEILSAGISESATIAAGEEIVLNSGVAFEDNVMNSGGAVFVESGGRAEDENLFGSETVASGGTDLQSMVDSGGHLVVENGGLAEEEFVFTGGRETILSGATSFGTFVAGGTLEVTGLVVFTGPIQFVNDLGPNGTLQIDGAVMPNTTIGGFSPGNTIDLASVPFVPGGSVTLMANNLLQVTEGGKKYFLQFNPSENLSNESFHLAPDTGSGTDVLATAPNPAPPGGTTDVLIAQRPGDGSYEIYDIGGNAILAAYALGQIATNLQVAGLGDFFGSDTSDMLVRNSNSGFLDVYNVSNNNITGFAALGEVGLEWTVAGLGDFSTRSGETDMLMRDSNTGQFEVYDISNNTITSAASMGQVGLEWQVAGFGDFSGNANETDMLMRDSATGQFEIYDIRNNAIVSAASMGQVGTEWQVAGFGDFSSRANETDMVMRDANTGAFEIYDISDNQLTSATPMGTVGLEWSVAGFGDFSGNLNETDMLMRDGITGQLELFDISNNQLTGASAQGAIGTDWQIAGIAADPPGASAPADAQLAQAMAAYAPAVSSDIGALAQTTTQSITASPVAASPDLTASNRPAPATGG